MYIHCIYTRVNKINPLLLALFFGPAFQSSTEAWELRSEVSVCVCVCEREKLCTRVVFSSFLCLCV